MTSAKKDFYGKEVTDAIKKACEELKVPQEQLEIEVIETGSTGIFGLIRKKAHISACIKAKQKKKEKEKKEVEEASITKKPVADKKEKPAVEESKKEQKKVQVQAVVDSSESSNDSPTKEKVEIPPEELSDESLQQIREVLEQLLQLMGYPSTVEVSARGTSVNCQVGDEFEEILTGQDGKTLDSLQYLLRKMVARKILNRIRLTVDVGQFREKRLESLKSRAVELADKVKADGKTQVIPALSPSERRVVHMSLQDDTEIRSRSVGDGLFKKILIYKPGKGNKNSGRRRSNSRGRKGGNSRKKSE